jgi:O-antigen/teichoic acid export membrane protein
VDNGVLTPFMTLKRSIVWSMVEAVGIVLLSLCSLVVLARILDPSDFGAAVLAATIAQALSLLIESMIRSIIVQREDLRPEHLNTLAVGGAILAVVVTIGLIAGAPLLAYGFGQPELTPLIQAASMLIPLGVASGLLGGQLQRVLRMREIAISTVTGRAAGSAIAIAAALGGLGLWSIVLQHLTTYAVSVFLFWRMLRWMPRLQFSKALMAQMIRFGGSIFLNEAIIIVTVRVLYILVGHIFGLATLGYLNIATRIIENVTDSLNMLVNQVVFPLFSRQQNELNRLRESIYRATELACLLAHPILAGIAVTAHEIILVVFGEQWTPSVPLVQLMAVASMLVFTIEFLNTAVVAVGQPLWRALKSSLDLAVTVVGLYALSDFGLLGPGVVVVLRVFVSAPVILFAASRLVELRVVEQMRRAVEPLVAAALMASVTALAKFSAIGEWPPLVRLACLVAIGGTCYTLFATLLAPRAVKAVLTAFMPGLVSGIGGRFKKAGFRAD